MKRILSVILAAIMLTAMCSTGVFAQRSLNVPTVIDFEGEKEKIITWDIDEDKYYEVHVYNAAGDGMALDFYKNSIEKENFLWGHETNGNTVMSFTSSDGEAGPFKKGIYYIRISSKGTENLSGRIYYKLAERYEDVSLNVPETIRELECVDKALDTLKTYRIMNGDPDGNIRAEDKITRAEAVALISRLYKGHKLVIEEKENVEFSDMNGHWAYDEVKAAAITGLVDGTGETAFEPERDVTMQEFTKMLISLLGYREIAERKGGYPHGYVSLAASLAITENITALSDESITRKDAAIMISNAFDIPLMSVKENNDSIEYVTLNGKDGVEYSTLRTNIENAME